MARFTYTVLSRAVPGREEEFIKWYTEQHLVDVLKMPGVVSGKLYRLDFQREGTLITIQEALGSEVQAEYREIDARGSTTHS